LRKGIIEPHNLDPRQILVGEVTKIGQPFYFSDAMNWILFEPMDALPYWIWSYVAGEVGDVDTLLGVIAVLRFAARLVGTSELGVARFLSDDLPQRMPRVTLNQN